MIFTGESGAVSKIAKLTRTELRAEMENLSGWNLDDEKLYKEFVFENFVDAFGFMTKIAITVEKMNHHPEWAFWMPDINWTSSSPLTRTSTRSPARSRTPAGQCIG